MADTLQIAPGYADLLGFNGLVDLESFFAWDGSERLDKPGLACWRERWRMVLRDGEGVEHTFYLKRFLRPPLGSQMVRWCSGYLSLGTAGIEWSNARQLSEAGILSVEPAAFGQRMAGIWEERSFILLREVVGESLERWVPCNLVPSVKETDLGLRRRRMDGLARFVAGFHRSGFVHRDLYLSHIFIGDYGISGEEGFRLIDLQRVFRPGYRRGRWVVKDLAALNYSTPAEMVGSWERMRFLCRYVRDVGEFGSARKLAKLVAAKTRRISRHNR
jgi:hypothetical protein